MEIFFSAVIGFKLYFSHMQKHKSKKEVMDEIILKSKFFKVWDFPFAEAMVSLSIFYTC